MDMIVNRHGGLATVVAVVAIFLAALWGGAYISNTVFDGLPHVEDEHAFLFEAKVIATGRLYTASPPYPEFFPTQFVIDHDGKRFGKYPPGWPAVLSLGVLAGQPHLVNPLLGAGALVLVFLVGRELYSTTTGLLAAALGLASPFFFLISGSFMSHSTTLFFLAAFVLLFIKGTRSNNLLFSLLAGASLGMAFITRQLTALGIALPYVLYSLIDLRHGKRFFLKYGIMALAFAPFALFLPYFNRLLTGDPFVNPYELWWSFDKIGFGPWAEIRPTLGARWIGTQTNLSLLSTYLFGWPAGLSLAFLLAPFALLTRRRWDWLMLATALSLAVAYTAYWTSGEMYGPRYFFEALPMLLILTARGIIEITGKLQWLAGCVVGRHRAGLPGPSTGPTSGLADGQRTVSDAVAAGFTPAGAGHSPLSPPGAPMKGATTASGPPQNPEGERRILAGAWGIIRLAIGRLWAPAVVAGLLTVLVWLGLTDYLPREMARFKGWYGVTSQPLSVVRRAGIHNALVFVSSERSWTEFASLDVANSPDYDSDVVFAVDHGFSNIKLTQLYLDRSLYRMVGNGISPYVPPQ